MHELSIAMSLIEVAEEEAQRRDATVVAIHLQLGPLSGVVKEALLSAYDLAREGSAMASARLVIQEMPIIAWCPHCEAAQTIASVQLLSCPSCGTSTPDLRGGNELLVTGLEIFDAPSDSHG
jgi:hydrogenase nickel incorporation protein HypA/HybF